MQEEDPAGGGKVGELRGESRGCVEKTSNGCGWKRTSRTEAARSGVSGGRTGVSRFQPGRERTTKWASRAMSRKRTQRWKSRNESRRMRRWWSALGIAVEIS